MTMTLTTLEKIRKAVEARPAELALARKSGEKVVGWLNYNIPEEIIYALDLIPIRLGIGGDERLVDLGARYISQNNCVFARESVGLFADGKDPYVTNSDAVAIDMTCYQIYRTAELIKYYFKVNTILLDFPRNFDSPEGHEYFRREVQAFAARLEELAGRKLTAGKLAEAITLYNGIREATKALYKEQAAPEPRIRWREVYEVVQAGYYLDRKVYLSLLDELLKEITSAPTGNNNGKSRILIAGSLIPPGDHKLINIVEQVGGVIVGDELWSGLTPSLNINIREPTLDAIADGYLGRIPHAAIPCLDIATDRRVANLRKLIKDFKADAVIYHTLRFCDPYTFKANETRELLKGTPFLEIHTEYAGSDVEAIRTRVEAFIELVDNR